MMNDTIEGENMELISVSGGKISYQRDTRFGWSNNQQIFWTNGNKGDELVLSFVSPAEKAGNMLAQFTIAPDYGSFSVSLNGKSLSGVINLNNPSVGTKRVNLGKVQLPQGDNKLKIEIQKPGPSDNKAFFGLDFLKILPTE